MVTYSKVSTPASAKSAYEAQLAKIEATKKFVELSKSATRVDALKILKGQTPSISTQASGSPTPNYYVNKSGAVTTIMPSNLDQFLEERGIDPRTPIENIPAEVFRPTKYLTLREQIEAEERAKNATSRNYDKSLFTKNLETTIKKLDLETPVTETTETTKIQNDIASGDRVDIQTTFTDLVEDPVLKDPVSKTPTEIITASVTNPYTYILPLAIGIGGLILISAVESKKEVMASA